MRLVPVICCYDNPATMSRECWSGGVLICSVNARLLCDADFKGGSWFDFRLNVGPWQMGKLWYGDLKAMEIKLG